MGDSVRYAESGDIHIAYRTSGDGPVDLMFVPTWASNLDLLDEFPPIAQGMERLGAFSRLILLDRRGSGLSDRMHGTATLEEGMDDLLAVLDAVGSERVCLVGLNESGALCALLAASHPQRVSHLILYGSYATTSRQDDYPWAPTPEERAEQIEFLIKAWGQEEFAFLMNPTAVVDPRFQRWGARWMRNSVTPDALRDAYDKLAHTDVRHVLPTIQVPTLVLHRTDDMLVPVDNGRYLAEKIPGSKFVELPGQDHIPFLGDWESVVDEIEEFITGGRRQREIERVLATILFTDIVGSTVEATQRGDRAWRELLEAHNDIVKSELTRSNGILVKTLGDGMLATFDGPARAIRTACKIRERIGSSLGLQIRAGLHTGEVERRDGDLVGIAVHIGARVAELAEPGEVLVSGSIPPLVAGAGIAFDDLGTRQLRGVDGEWRIHRARV
jgi:pimeloyl-ACP methyl ester carboxylesterase/class 3 adenylate cyclase